MAAAAALALVLDACSSDNQVDRDESLTPPAGVDDTDRPTAPSDEVTSALDNPRTRTPRSPDRPRRPAPRRARPTASRPSTTPLPAEHPDAPVLSRSTGHEREHFANPYVGYGDPDSEPLFALPTDPDSRLTVTARAVGADRGNDAVAVSRALLADRGASA